MWYLDHHLVTRSVRSSIKSRSVWNSPLVACSWCGLGRGWIWIGAAFEVDWGVHLSSDQFRCFSVIPALTLMLRYWADGWDDSRKQGENFTWDVTASQRHVLCTCHASDHLSGDCHGVTSNRYNHDKPHRSSMFNLRGGTKIWGSTSQVEQTQHTSQVKYVWLARYFLEF